jgi:hypothetical protein
MAKPTTDFTAQAQNFTGVVLSDGAPGFTIAPGVVTVTAAIGNPVKHTNTGLTRTNLSVLINLTNVCDTVGTPGCNTNLTDLNGRPYQVTTTTLTLNEFDNALGGEVVLWSNPLTNAFDSTNWTLVHASINQGLSPTLPTVISNYDNSANLNGVTDYLTAFGKPVNEEAGESGVTVPQSDVMLANGWSNALKVAVNKYPALSGESGVNLYPQIPGAPWTGSNFMVFQGNYALRFDMFLSLYDFGIFNPTIGTPAREFAAFGINHYGTNANWRLDSNPRADGTGARPINADGEWCSIGAASGSITPADWDMFISPAFARVATNGVITPQVVPYTTNLFTNLVVGGANSFSPLTNAYQSGPGVFTGDTNYFANNGVPNDQVSQGNNSFGGAPENGIIKNPPFLGINNLGGAPDNAWVDVSLELTRQTNLVLKVAQQAIFNSSTITPPAGTANPIAPFGGTPMLGYLDPNRDISDYSAFVYYSNVRVVELSPFIPWTNQTSATLPANNPGVQRVGQPAYPGGLPGVSLLVTQGTSFTLSSGATYASNPLTNIWYRGTTNGVIVGGSFENGTPTALVLSNSFAATSATADLNITNIQSGTNYISVWSDQAGSVTGFLAVVEVVAGPASKIVNAGVTTNLVLTTSGQNPPFSYQWMRYGTNLAASTHFAPLLATNGNVITSTLWITNVTAADATVYSNLVTARYQLPATAGNITTVAQGALSVVGAPAPASQTKLWGDTAQFTVSASGGTPFTYQWKRAGTNLSDGGNVAGATTSALTVGPVTTVDQLNNYAVGVTNSAGGVVAGNAALTVLVPPPTLTGVALVNPNVVVFFSSTNNVYDATNAFILQSSVDVAGPYTNTPGTFTTSNGTFQVTLPQTDSQRFYRLLHVQ